MGRHRFVLTAVAAFALLAAVRVSSAPPASAAEQPAITVGPGQTVARAYTAIPADAVDSLPQPIGTMAPAPAQCASAPASAYCDEIPITLNVPAKTLKHHSYTVNAQVSWPTTTINNGVTGNLQSDQLDLFFWEDPPAGNNLNGNPTFDSASEGSAPPATVSIVGPKSVHLDLVVANNRGVNSGYNVVVSVIDFSTVGPPIDHSVDTIPDFSNNTAVPQTPTPAPTAPTALATPAESPGVPAGPAVATPLPSVTPAPDAQLQGLAPTNDAQALAAAPVRNIRSLGGARLGPARPASATGVLLALLPLPVVLAAAIALFWRRRRTATTIT